LFSLLCVSVSLWFVAVSRSPDTLSLHQGALPPAPPSLSFPAMQSWMSSPLAVFGGVDWAIVVLYLAGMVLIGHVVGRRKTDAEGYFLAGRSTPMWAVILSTIATTLSAATFLGAPESAFSGDLSYFVLNIGGFLAVLFVAALFIPKFYRAGTVTIYGYINQRLGEPARIACSAMFLLGRMLASGARLFIAAAPVCLLVFRESTPPRSHLIAAIILVGAIGIAYTTAGGIKAVIWTDTAQILIVMGGGHLERLPAAPAHTAVGPADLPRAGQAGPHAQRREQTALARYLARADQIVHPLDRSLRQHAGEHRQLRRRSRHDAADAHRQIGGARERFAGSLPTLRHGGAGGCLW